MRKIILGTFMIILGIQMTDRHPIMGMVQVVLGALYAGLGACDKKGDSL